MASGFKPRRKHEYIGTYQPRIDGHEKASGQAKYVDDITLKLQFPGMLYAKVLRSPYPHARIQHLDVSKAERLPGVKAILKYDDPEIACLKPTNAAWGVGAPPRSYNEMWFPHLRDERILSNHVCWVGDEAGVVVSAETEDIAEEALRLIDVEWEVLPFVINPMEAIKKGAPIIHPEIDPHSNVLPSPPQPIVGKVISNILVEKGNTERAFADSDEVIEVKTTFHNCAVSGSLDNWCCLVSWTGNTLTVWSNSYAALQTRMYISEMLGIPLNKIRVISPYVGGSFGRGDSGEQKFFIYTALLAKKTNRPVKFRHSKQEEFVDGRTGEYQYCKMGAKKDGRITAIQIQRIADAGGYARHTQGETSIVASEWIERNLGHIPSLDIQSYGVYTNRSPGSCKRAIGNQQFNFLIGLALDVLAEKLSLDPLQLAVSNFQEEEGDLPNENLKAVLYEGAKRIGWEKRHKPGKGRTYKGSKKSGMGFSFNHNWSTSDYSKMLGPLHVIVKVNPDGTVYLEAPMVETGSGSNTCCVLACAETLGVCPENVHWISTVDTETVIKEAVQTGSKCSTLYPEIIRLVALDAKRKLLELAAQELKVKPEQLDIDDGRIYIKATPQKGTTIKDVLWQGEKIPIVSYGKHQHTGEGAGFPYLATFAKVEVDTETGAIDVLKLVVCHDCGTVMCASGAEAQQLGAQAMSVGEVLTEELIYDEATGIPLNFNWIDYKIPTMADYPIVEPVLMEVWKGSGEYGSCGLAESSALCAPRAIANAIYNAIGVRVEDTPITPDKVLKALGRI